MDFLISYKIWRNNPIHDLLATRTLSKVLAGILNKHIRTSQYEKIYDEFNNIMSPSEIKIFMDVTFAINALELNDNFWQQKLGAQTEINRVMLSIVDDLGHCRTIYQSLTLKATNQYPIYWHTGASDCFKPESCWISIRPKYLSLDSIIFK